MNEDTIHTEDVLQCPLCGNKERRTLYTDLRDRLFGVPGKWTLKECCHCAVAFLDPRPMEDEISKAYKTYKTHRSEPIPANTALRRFWRTVRNGYLERKFGYRRSDNPAWARRLAFLVYLHPVGRATLEGLVMYLPALAPGARVLEVGCGNGRNLESLREWGWAVEGVEPDAKAVEVAHGRGLTVYQGDLASQHFEPGTFDVVFTNHVIEHVHDPVALVRECRRILKPDGTFVTVTPNMRSITHWLFRSSALHLDPPRHLVLFEPQTLTYVADRAGMQIVHYTTTARGAKELFRWSLDIWRKGFADRDRQLGLLEIALGWIYHVLERILVKFNKDVGEEILLTARRPGHE